MGDTLVRNPVSEIAPPDTDKDKLTHIVGPPNAEARVMEARVMGTPVTALCGHTWVPSRDPYQYPKCRPCVDRLDEIMKSRGRI